MKTKNQYVIITPAHNEENYIDETIRSVIHQTVKPLKWIIVNDNSTDKTKKIIEKYIDKYKWIEVIDSTQPHEWDVGGKQIKMFYEGYNLVKDLSWDIIIKLDADIKFDSDYFERLFKEFDNDKKLGIISGCTDEKDLKYFHVRGASKIYRKACFSEIHLIPVYGWDSIDEVTALMKGWKTKQFNVPFIHLKNDSVDGLKRRYNEGKTMYTIGSSFLRVMYTTVKKTIQKPFIVGGFYFFIGYVYGFLFLKRPVSKEFILFLRRIERDIGKSKLEGLFCRS